LKSRLVHMLWVLDFLRAGFDRWNSDVHVAW
jgi:hypothetical protein